MSVQSAHIALPSPSKASTSTKRPYESNTPSALGTPKDTTGNNGRSPSQTTSGDRNNKKARIGDEAAGSSKELGKGGQWIVAKLEELERMYKEVLLAATAVIQYQTYTLKLYKKVRKVPSHLERRVKISWGNFEATRRHVQAYMHEAAQDASTPSSRNIPMSVPLPPPSTSLSVSDIPANIPLTSPIPLSAATMLSFQPDSGIVSATPALVPSSAPIPQNTTSQVNNENFAFNMLSTLPGNNAGGIGNLDLSNISMGDLAGLMGNNGFDFTTLLPQNNTQAQITSQTQDQAQGQSQMQTQMASNGSVPVPNTIPTAQTETDRILAQFGNTTSAVQADGSDDDMTALLASLGDGDAAPDFTNIDFGDMDFSNLGDMSGLFNTSTVPVDTASANDPQPLPQSQPQPQPQSQPQSQPQPQPPLDPNTNTVSQPTQVVEPTHPTQQTSADTTNAIAEATLPVVDAVDPNLDMSNVFDESQAIDLDDFNFEGGDQGGEGGVGISGDEFESLLAAFN